MLLLLLPTGDVVVEKVLLGLRVPHLWKSMDRRMNGAGAGVGVGG